MPTAVSLFSGAGGFDVGLESAGFCVVACVEHGADCIETLRTNQGARITVPGSDRVFLEDARLLQSPIENVLGRDLRPAGHAGNWTPDLLVGGPPCQPFSAAGKQRGLSDPRGTLFHDFVRLASELRPRTILMENVRGLVTARGRSGEPGEVIRTIKSAFEELRYGTAFALVNAADYGAPQRRVRLFMLASRYGPLPCFPDPTHAQRGEDTLLARLEPWITLGEFLDSFPTPHETEVVRPSKDLAIALADVPPGSGLRSPGARETTRPGGHWGYRQGTFIADPCKPARTVTASSTQDWVRLRDGSLRRLTLAECAGLQGFPPAWRFAGSNASKFRQVGNAVQTRVAHVLGEALLESLRSRTRVPPRSAPLPAAFVKAIDYTARENRRNGESRRAVRLALARNPAAALRLKGLGNEESSSTT